MTAPLAFLDDLPLDDGDTEGLDSSDSVLLDREAGREARAGNVGRPRKWNRDALIASVCQRIADGQSLRAACKALGVSPRRVSAYIGEVAAYASQYDAARKAQAHLLHGDLLDVARESLGARSPEEAKGYQNVMRAIDSIAASGDRQAFGKAPELTQGGEVRVRIVLEEAPKPKGLAAVAAAMPLLPAGNEAEG